MTQGEWKSPRFEEPEAKRNQQSVILAEPKDLKMRGLQFRAAHLEILRRLDAASG
jgi:hypothetical protein